MQAREKLEATETKLSRLIYERGVDGQGFARIRSKGDAALFGGASTQAMKKKLEVITILTNDITPIRLIPMFKLATLIIVLLLALSLQGQSDRFSIGLQAGPLFATIKPDPDVLDAQFRTGFFAGANARYAFTERWAVQGDVQFSQRGFHYETRGALIILDGQFASYRGRIDYKISYIDFMPQIEFRPLQYLGIAVGPYMSWQVSESIRYGDVIDWTSTNDNNLFNDADLGLSARLNGHIGPVTVFVSYLHGLADISKIILTDENGQFLGQLAANSRAIAFGAAFNF